MKPLILLRPDSYHVFPRGGFTAHVRTTDDVVWEAMKAGRAVLVVMGNGQPRYVGEGLVDLVDGDGVRVSGARAKRLGPVGRLFLRLALARLGSLYSSTPDTEKTNRPGGRAARAARPPFSFPGGAW